MLSCRVGIEVSVPNPMHNVKPRLWVSQQCIALGKPTAGMYAKAETQYANPVRDKNPPPGKGDCTKCYCLKDGDFHDFGEDSSQGKRTDCDVAVEGLKSGLSFGEIVSERPSTLRLIGAMQKVQPQFQVDRNWKTRVTVIHGTTGSQKTNAGIVLMRIAGKDKYYFKRSGSGKWFDLYSGHEAVVLDEVHGGKEGLSLSDLMGLLNYEPTSVETKGGTIKWAPKWLVMTSTTKFEDWYSYIDKDGCRVRHSMGMLSCPICKKDDGKCRLSELKRRIDHWVTNVSSYDNLLTKLRAND